VHDPSFSWNFSEPAHSYRYCNRAYRQVDESLIFTGRAYRGEGIGFIRRERTAGHGTEERDKQAASALAMAVFEQKG